MKKTSLLLTCLFLVGASACDDPAATAPESPATPASPSAGVPPTTPAAPATPAASQAGSPAAPASAPASGAAPAGSTVVKSVAPGILAGMIPKSGISGVVKETMGGGGYTYILLSTKHGDFWCAGPEVPAKKGDKAKVMEGVLMENFSSKTLGKTFENIYFVRGIELGDAPAGAATSGPTSGPASAPGGPASAPASASASAPASAPKKGEIAVPAGGHTVEQLWVQKATLGGKAVTLRGRAVKVTSGLVGGLNWLHVQDGSGGPGTNDIIVTTKTDVKIGDTVLAKGILTLDKEMGPGMKYDALVHNAEVKVE